MRGHLHPSRMSELIWRSCAVCTLAGPAVLSATWSDTSQGTSSPVWPDNPAADVPPGKAAGPAVAQLRRHLDALAAQDAFSGTVLIARGREVLFEQAYGYADRAFNVRNRVDTKFNLGSMGKMFTAVAILQLAQAGRLSLDDTLAKLVPGYPDKDIAARITVYQLLTHTSGLGDIFNEKYRDTPKDRLDTIQAHLALFAGQPLLFEPGTKWSYSNAGYIVLGLIIERVSGQSYYDYVRQHIFKPARMINTDNYKLHDDVANLALGYTTPQAPGRPSALNFPGGLPPAGKRITNSDFLQPGASAGGGYSTVEDLLRFSQALQGHELLNEQYTTLAMKGKVATDRGTAQYAFGLIEDFINGVRIVGHSGGGPGINSNLDMYPQLGYTVAVMTNCDGAVALANERIRWWLTGRELPRAVRLDSEALETFTGTYQVSTADAGPRSGGDLPPVSLEIAADTEGLWLTSGTRHRLLPLSATEFFDDNAPALRVTFGTDGQGQVTGFTFIGPGGRSVEASRR
jgi:CubicO group peptidase (beta-lactamase class C family)